MIKAFVCALLVSASLAQAQPNVAWQAAPAPEKFDCGQCDVYKTGSATICKGKGLMGATEETTEQAQNCFNQCQPYAVGTPHERCITKGLMGSGAPTEEN